MTFRATAPDEYDLRTWVCVRCIPALTLNLQFQAYAKSFVRCPEGSGMPSNSPDSLALESKSGIKLGSVIPDKGPYAKDPQSYP